MTVADEREFRRVLGHLPTGVVVVAGSGTRGPWGVTIGSFLSVSLDPPLVGFMLDRRSRTHPEVVVGSSWCASVLSDEQDETCWRFAREPESGDRFDGVAHRISSHGTPMIDGAVAWVEAITESVTPAGDHSFVLGRVTHLEIGAGEAMVFYKGRVAGVTPEA